MNAFKRIIFACIYFACISSLCIKKACGYVQAFTEILVKNYEKVFPQFVFTLN